VAREWSEPKIERICAQFWGWVAAAAREGRNEHECSFRGQGTVGVHLCSILGLGGGSSTGGQKRARMLISGSGDGGSGQRIIKTPKSSTYMLNFRVGRWRPQAKGSQNPETSTNSRFRGGGRKRAGRTLKTSSRACFQIGRMVVAAKECRNPKNEYVLLVFGVGG